MDSMYIQISMTFVIITYIQERQGPLNSLLVSANLRQDAAQSSDIPKAATVPKGIPTPSGKMGERHRHCRHHQCILGARNASPAQYVVRRRWCRVLNYL